MRMLVLGAGLQGSACAFDLLNNPAVTRVILADLRVDTLQAFLKPHVSSNGGGRLVPTVLDVRDEGAVLALMAGCDAVQSAIPYYFNLRLAQLAVQAGVHFTDLGGNTEIVLRQKELNGDARAKGVSVVPDTGLAPGMVNIIAQHGINQFDKVASVRMFVGGLPQHPEPPLNYQIVYSIEGVVDYYTTPSLVIRDGKPTEVNALTEVVPVHFPEPTGALEAFHTAGGLSTMVYRYANQIPVMEYKTLRYPGHAAIMAGVRQLGLLSSEPVDVKGQTVTPRDVFVKVVGDKLRRPSSPDLVALRVVVTGTRGGQQSSRAWQLVDHYDTENGLTAMMRTTGYTLSITGQLQAMREIAPGVHTTDECIPPELYFEMLAERGVIVSEVAVS
ncbi:MAG: saccharopine dehydrogenase NADP-binding domain-containing protein [Phycisphaerae bacterium]|nr:saccharopine dehydrogenase NADP-binding domain-containing protein [Gemmatimonadaceae bacterium]